MGEQVVPSANAEDSDDVVVALETARVSEERGDLESASKWLHRAAAAARHQGRPERAGVLSRAAARLARSSANFEPKREREHVFSDFEEDEFSEKTIVETAAQIEQKAHRSESDVQRSASPLPEVKRPSSPPPEVKRPSSPPPAVKRPSSPPPAVKRPSSPPPAVKRPSSPPPAVFHASMSLVEKPTPIAPLSAQPKAAPHHAIRVGVKRTLGGKFEARPLGEGEGPAAGEQEALLVPTQTGAKLS